MVTPDAQWTGELTTRFTAARCSITSTSIGQSGWWTSDKKPPCRGSSLSRGRESTAVTSTQNLYPQAYRRGHYAVKPNSTWLVTSRHDKHDKVMHVGLISKHANRHLLSFFSVNFRLDLDYLHSEPRR